MKVMRAVTLGSLIVVVASAGFVFANNLLVMNQKKVYGHTQKRQNHQKSSVEQLKSTSNESLSMTPSDMGLTPEQYAEKYPSKDLSSEESKKGLDVIQNPNPFGDEYKNRGIVDDSDIQRYILRMVRDKNEISYKRIDWLLSAIMLDKMGLKHKNVYNKVLKRWKANDFSQLQIDQRTIENLQIY
ncbi:hypothetical protein SAMN02982927_01282 [Sporolactobacillus nakayamae]|uniref:Uncharacterized protein n=2 Tax=Sporolactobacillus nakayamae TaxID=269670 RepID=A0A1I2QLY2_9BACL|nr:hypothetical protein SAMN02982927_01282 [Sporolactobacillus nakayamae]